MKSTLKSKICSLTLGAVLALPLMASKPAYAGTEDYLGEIILVGYTFCPRGTLDASGQLLPIAQYSALFSLYGTQFGGDGRTTFGLPDLRSRSPIHVGQGPGLTDHRVGQNGGTENFTLTTSQMPSHNHQAVGTNTSANRNGPENKLLAKPDGTNIYSETTTDEKLFKNDMIRSTGGGQAVPKRSPFLTLRYCVNINGVFPSRN